MYHVEGKKSKYWVIRKRQNPKRDYSNHSIINSNKRIKDGKQLH